MSVIDWTDAVRAQYAGQGLGGRLTPRGRPALIVVDLVRGFTDPACPPGFDMDDVVTSASRLVDAARDAGVPVFFTTIAFRPDELAETVWLRKMPALQSLVEGTRWVEVDDRLQRRETEPLLTKKAASAFAGTELEPLLRAVGVDTLVVCGATTSGCVRATVIDACALGWPTFVPRGGVGDRAAGPHEANLLDIDAKYADVVHLDEALAILDPAGAVRS
jgi:nicotinamidase-related amidase